MNIIEKLKSEHQELIRVMDALEMEASRGSDKCDDLFQKFKQLFNAHDEVEDKVLYPTLLRHNEFAMLARKGYQAHHMVHVGMLELRLVPYESDSWAPKFSVIRDSILTHMQEEEEKIFNKIENFITREEMQRMNAQFSKIRGEKLTAVG